MGETIRASILVLACSTVIAGLASGQAYPSRPIRLIVPSAAGGAPDIQARLFANELNRQMGQQIVVDNRPGGSGIIGFDMIAKAPADGYTIGFASFAIMTIPAIFVKLPYDAIRDFAPIMQQSIGPNILTVSLSLPVKSVQDLVTLARAQPGKLMYGSSGAGTSIQLSMELFKSLTGTKIIEVSYKGVQQAVTEVIGGQIHILCDNISSILPHVRSGKLRALGVTTQKRSTAVPELPTIAEAGIPGYEMAPSSGYIAPARVPRDILVRLNAEFNKALQSPPITDRFAANGSILVGGTPDHFAEHIRSEIVKWAKVIKTAGINPQ